MKLHDFHRKFEALSREERFELIDFQAEPTSFFVIFQQLTQVRSQKKFFEDREAHLLKQAEEAFEKLNGKHIQGPQQ